MTSQTVFIAERELYLALLQLSRYHPIAHEWLAKLPEWLTSIKDKQRYAYAPAYLGVIEKLPNLTIESVNLNTNTITIHTDLNHSQHKQITALLKQLMPWRKGPFQIGSNEHKVFIDTEWRSDWKWQRIVPHISSLEGRRVLDVGGGSGYHGWRMTGVGAKMVVIIDPSCLFYHQFMAIRHFIGSTDNYTTHFIPVGLEALPSNTEQYGQLFDTVFCMGVLYHRPSPFEHLQQLKNQLRAGGELVLETLVVEGDKTTVLVPHERYAKMNNVYFLPSVSALIVWLEKVGFREVRCVNIEVTSIKEQRATEWMNYQSLSNFLDPNDNSKTIEGYPAPKRAIFVAIR